MTDVFKETTGFDFQKRYYLAGPMSGIAEYNYPHFDTCTGLLRSAGIEIRSPHEVTLPEEYAKMTEKDLWTAMMTLTKIMMMSCHGIILLRGWPHSKGAKIELQFALDHEWPVYYYDNYTLTSMNREDL